MKKSNQFGLSAIETLLIIVILGIVGFTGWFVWHSKQATDTSLTNTANSQPSIAKKKAVTTKETTDTTTAQKYLVIKEWGVRIPVSDADNDADLTYTYTKNDTYEGVFFGFQRLVDHGMCKNGIGYSLGRQTTANQPPYSIDNPDTFIHVGDYYYYTAQGGSYCYDDTDQSQLDYYNSTKISPQTVKAAVTKLELAQ